MNDKSYVRTWGIADKGKVGSIIVKIQLFALRKRDCVRNWAFMTESEVIVVMRQHLEGKFPKKCGVCDRTYVNLKDYLLHTKHVGPPKSYDADMGVFKPTQPIGTMSLANCSCGNTLVMDSSGMNLKTLWGLMGWLCGEMMRRRQKASAVLEDLRRSIDQATLADSPSVVHRPTVTSTDSFPSAPVPDSRSGSS